MTGSLAIRETGPDDIARVLALYPHVFPEEDLRPVVSALLGGGWEVLSLAAFDGRAVLAHVLFTICGTVDSDRSAALLGPLAVLPARQRRGSGSALVRAGLARLEKRGVRQVLVLGDPGYYRRFGFSPERRVLPPFPIPGGWADAWQSLPLAAGEPLAAGRLVLPEPWMAPALWGP